MAVTLTDRRTIINEADSLTDWTGPSELATVDIVESTGAVAGAINEGTDYYVYDQVTSIDLSDTLIYVWAFNNALQPGWNTTGGGGRALVLGDGTDLIAFHMSGSDRDVFKHLEGPVNWQCLVLDGSQISAKNTAGETTVLLGSFANFNSATVFTFGANFVTESKALAGGYNVAVDIMRYGNLGIRITGGGTGTEGKWTEIAAADRSTANQAGHGAVRQLQPIAFGLQAPITFGDSGTATNSIFSDSGVAIIFENWDIGNDKYFLNVEGNSGATNTFELFNSTITTGGPFVSIDCSSANIDTLVFESVSFVALGNSVSFSNNIPVETGFHAVTGCTFDGCGQIDPGDVNFENNSISNSTAGATGALLLDADGTGNWANLNITGGTGVGHGIYITAGGSYTFDNIQFSDFGANSTTDAAVYNNSGTSVTINITGGGNTPTVRNGSGASTTVLNTVTLLVTVVDSDGNPVSGARVRIEQTSNGTQISQGTTGDSGIYQDSTYNYTANLGVTTKVRLKGYRNFRTAGTITTSGLTVGVTLARDSIVDLP
jgi:hypothetical protein